MDFRAFIAELRASPDYAGQIVYVHETPPREARYADLPRPLGAAARAALRARGVERLYSHQVEAVERVRDGLNVLIATGTASGKSLCYVLPILDLIAADPQARALLLFPTKALCQDQFRGFRQALDAAGMEGVMAGVYDGDTPANLRRRLRDRAAVLFTNPDMLHASIMPQHGRWADFISRLKLVVMDELHVYTGIFGSNAANLFRRFLRVCGHYGSAPRMVACSATIRSPGSLAAGLTGQRFAVVDNDGSPGGRRFIVFWNPPRVRSGRYRSRRSANVEAHELMARLLQAGAPTITFSKAKMTAEMIYRYVCEKLDQTAPHLKKRVCAYRGGYRPEERRGLERRLFSGDLIGVSCTRALELGIDVGELDASVIVGYPGTLAGFLQQSGRAGRRDRDSLVILIGLDTAVNQYVMTNPDYLLGRPVEQAVIEPDNPFVLTGHLRCAAHELALGDDELPSFGPHADLVLRILQENRKVRRIRGRWYYAATETPQHEVSLRDYVDANVLIEDVDTGEVIGEVNKFDAPPILHPEAIYMSQGDTYRVLTLDLEKNIARVKREEVDYYTQPLGGTDVHHVDHCLREKPFGTGAVFWGEVTAYFRNHMYEKIHFYTLDAISRHGLDLPTFALETLAFWLVPPEDLTEQVRLDGLDAHAGLRGVGYATRMVLPLFMTCDTLDFSHTVGSVNSPWQAIFIYERYPHGLGFTEKAYDNLHDIMPAVLAHVAECECEDGCPCCVGKPLRPYATWNVERGEASIPSKKAALAILEGLLGDCGNLRNPDTRSLTDSAERMELRLERALRRRLERVREPQVFHAIEPAAPTEYPEPEAEAALDTPDVARRAERRRDFDRDQRRRLATKIRTSRLDPIAGAPSPPPGMRTSRGNAPPTRFCGRPSADAAERPPEPRQPEPTPRPQGNALAARARRLKKRRNKKADDN